VTTSFGFVAVRSKRGLAVRSFGSGQQVKLPGTSLEKPNVYSFDTSYEFMYKDLTNKDVNVYVDRSRRTRATIDIYARRYTQNGVLHMLDRNRRIKDKPERFQDCRERFDIIFTVEERIFDQVMEGRVRWKQSHDEHVHF
jgi:RNA polymerase II subunit A C-terminal domain phosphatase SSU72